ncbi:MAG: CPBP family glutamic-type intramembrane protease [Chitinophagaceae bacterium]
MKVIFEYIIDFWKRTDKKALFSVTVFTGILVYINFHFLLDDVIRKENIFWIKLFLWYGVFLSAFALAYLIVFLHKPLLFPVKAGFWILLLIAPAIFSLKLSLSFSFRITDDTALNNYWNQVLYWPFLLFIVMVLLFIIWIFLDNKQSFFGLKAKGIYWKPYLIMLLVMIPLIVIASTQHDFLATYPKLKTAFSINNNSTEITFWKIIIYELSYGSDFISIELFFRGFLILAFIKWVGKDAILPMACFYCTIHFGKPLGECISSYFGGILLGIVVYNTRSIWGGLLVHLGIAWLMEVGGYIGNHINQ